LTNHPSATLDNIIQRLTAQHEGNRCAVQ
jgi:hypothetical protein